MKSREILHQFWHLAYATGYEQAKKDIENDRVHKVELDYAFRKGRMHEAAKTDTRKAADIMGGVNET